MKLRCIVLAFFFMLWGVHSVSADEIFLKNGDRISGTLIKESRSRVAISTEAMGTITVKKENIDRSVTADGIERTYGAELTQPPEPMQKKSDWKKQISVGYSESGGNTEKSQGNLSASFTKKSGYDEWAFKGTAYYSSSEEKMDGKKFYGMGRYAYSFGEHLKWYTFYKVEGDQDRFANIDYRIIPSAGIGHWFSDTDEFKAMLELGAGYQYTDYRDATKSSGEAVLIPRAFLEKILIGSLKLTQDLVLYPSLKDAGEYRLHSESAISHPINDTLSWKISFIDDYNSQPSGTTKRNDYRFISSLDYSF